MKFLAEFSFQQAYGCVRGRRELLQRFCHGAVLHPCNPDIILVFGGWGPPAAGQKPQWLNDLLAVNFKRQAVLFHLGVQRRQEHALLLGCVGLLESASCILKFLKLRRSILACADGTSMC